MENGKSNKPLEMHDYIRSDKARKDMQLLLIRNDVDEERVKISNELPTALFSYHKVNEYIIDDLIKKQITLTDPNLFNDLYDSTLHVNSETSERKNLEELNSYLAELKAHSIFGESLELVDIDQSIADMNYPERDKRIMRVFSKDYRIKCFSEMWDSILMWSHYADNSRGICIEYDFSEDERAKNFLPVTYLKDPLDFSDIADHSIPIGKLDNDNQLSMAVLLSISTKNDVWKYESEWRFILPLVLLGNTMPSRISCKKIPIPKTIILGAHFAKQADENSKEILLKILNYAKERSIPLKVAKPKILSYELETLEITYHEALEMINKDGSK